MKFKKKNQSTSQSLPGPIIGAPIDEWFKHQVSLCQVNQLQYLKLVKKELHILTKGVFIEYI